MCVHCPSFVSHTCVYLPSLQDLFSQTISLLSQGAEQRLGCFTFFIYPCVWACMSALICMLNRPIFIDPCCRAFSQTLSKTQRQVHAHVCVSVCAHHYSACPSMCSSRCMDKKSLNQWVKYGGVHAATHTLMHTLMIVCLWKRAVSAALTHHSSQATNSVRPLSSLSHPTLLSENSIRG